MQQIILNYFEAHFWASWRLTLRQTNDHMKQPWNFELVREVICRLDYNEYLGVKSYVIFVFIDLKYLFGENGMNILQVATSRSRTY